MREPYQACPKLLPCLLSILMKHHITLIYLYLQLPSLVRWEFRSQIRWEIIRGMLCLLNHLAQTLILSLITHQVLLLPNLVLHVVVEDLRALQLNQHVAILLGIEVLLYNGGRLRLFKIIENLPH
jgi:hypothetical protein